MRKCFPYSFFPKYLGRFIICMSFALGMSAHVAQAQRGLTAQTQPAQQMIQLATYIEYQVKGTVPSFPDVGTIIQPNQQLISFTIAPRFTIITKSASLRRPGAFPESLPIGTPMFQVGVDNGFAFCAFWDARQGERPTQCFRDINNDGTFDASYLTNRPLVGRSLYIGRIARLESMPPVPYEIQATSQAPEEFTFRFLRIKDGVAEFKPQFGLNRRGFRIVKCDLSDQEGCNLGGHQFFFAQAGTSVNLKSVVRGGGVFLLFSEQTG